MAKKLEITRKNYDTIKDLIKMSSCMAVVHRRVQEMFNFTRDQAHNITSAVNNDYKYLKIVD